MGLVLRSAAGPASLARDTNVLSMAIQDEIVVLLGWRVAAPALETASALRARSPDLPDGNRDLSLHELPFGTKPVRYLVAAPFLEEELVGPESNLIVRNWRRLWGFLANRLRDQSWANLRNRVSTFGSWHCIPHFKTRCVERTRTVPELSKTKAKSSGTILALHSASTGNNGRPAARRTSRTHADDAD